MPPTEGHSRADQPPAAPRQPALLVLRAVISVFLAASLSFINFRGRDLDSAWFRPGLVAVAVYFSLAVIFYLIRAGGRATAAFHTSAQVAADLALAVSLTLLTGGVSSPFTFIFVIAIINSALLGGLRASLTVATFSSALWGGVLTLNNAARWPSFLPRGLASFQSLAGFPAPPDNLPHLLLDQLIINTGACYLVAFLSGHLAGQLLLSRRALASSQVRLGRLEETVRRSEHLAALGEMAAGLAHELRTPLTSLTGAWHIMARGDPNQEDRKRLSGIIGREMDRLVKLTNDFLSFARPPGASPVFFDLSAVAADQLLLFGRRQRPGLILDNRLAPTPPVYFDRDHFSQIFWNILANAVEAGAKNETIRIVVETGRDPVWPGFVILKVSDDGAPIPPENLPRLFEPFFTTKPTGNGLGLATVSRLLHEGGGHIAASQHPPGFTTFSVFLPVGAPAQPW